MTVRCTNFGGTNFATNESPISSTDFNDTFNQMIKFPIGGITGWAKTFNQKATGTNTSTSSSKLIDSGASFNTLSLQAGWIVQNVTDGTFANVVTVDSATQITLDANIFTATSKTYKIWNTPKLPFGWVECNGQTLSDAASIFNGATIPNLNSGTQRFLRGSTTSGTTGGADTATLSAANLASHSHGIVAYNQSAGASNKVSSTSNTSGQSVTDTSNSAGSGTAFNILPSYYEIVFIMRVK